jgi:hypothetical protein
MTSGSQRSREGNYVSRSSSAGARVARRRTRAAITTAAALIAAAAFAGPAQADLTASPDRTIIPHYPDFVQSTNPAGQQAAVCVAELGNPCGPDAASIADMTDPGPGGDAEAFYWSGAATANVGAGDVTIAFDVEVATVGAEPGITPVTPGDFQRIQVQGDANLPNGIYTFVTPFGTFRAEKTTLNADGRWFRADTAGVTTGPIDHFLTQVGAPAGFYGDLTPAPTTDGAKVFVFLPGNDPAAPGATPDGTATEWEILGALVGNPITLPPADTDKDGVPDASDNCPAVAGPASNGGCPVAQQAPVVTPPVTNTVTRVIPGAGAAAQNQSQGVLGTQASSALRVSNLSLARRISVTRLRRQGLRMSMRVPQGTNVLRIAVYKARNGQKTGSALLRTTRSPRAGLYRVTLRNRSLLRKLRAGSYVVEVRAGRSAASLGSIRRITFTVTR